MFGQESIKSLATLKWLIKETNVLHQLHCIFQQGVQLSHKRRTVYRTLTYSKSMLWCLTMNQLVVFTCSAAEYSMYGCQLRGTSRRRVWKRMEADWDASVWWNTVLWQRLLMRPWTQLDVLEGYFPIRSEELFVYCTVLHFRSHPGLAPTFSLCFLDFSFAPPHLSSVFESLSYFPQAYFTLQITLASSPLCLLFTPTAIRLTQHALECSWQHPHSDYVFWGPQYASNKEIAVWHLCIWQYLYNDNFLNKDLTSMPTLHSDWPDVQCWESMQDFTLRLSFFHSSLLLSLLLSLVTLLSVTCTIECNIMRDCL